MKEYYDTDYTQMLEYIDDYLTDEITLEIVQNCSRYVFYEYMETKLDNMR